MKYLKPDSFIRNIAAIFFAVTLQAAPSDGVAGKVPGFTSWVVPATANGLIPRQAWLSMSSTQAGDIYLAGSDHKTNSALYRLRAGEDRLSYVGDAKSASEAANNWLPAETAEKFHVRPLFYRDRVYVATSDYSNADDGYLKKRGFHWYAYDENADKFLDLSATEPKGVGGEHAGLFAMALDEKRGLLYGHDSPRGFLYCYDIATGKTRNLGRPPSCPDGYYMPGRYLWVNHAGRLYFTISTSDHVLYFDPSTGFGERKDWKLQTKDVIKVFRSGTQSWNRERVYLSDREGWFYRYDKSNDTFEVLGQAVTDNPQCLSKGALKIRALNITADERKLYFVNDESPELSFWEWDLVTQTTRKLCTLEQLDDRLGVKTYFNHGGNDTWDNNGSLYFCSFGKDTSESTILILSRLDPVKLKVQLGLLPELVEVTITKKDAKTVTLTRTGATTHSQEVIVKAQGGKGREADVPSFLRYTIPAGSSSLDLDVGKQIFPGVTPYSTCTLVVLGNGNDYRAGNPCRVITP